MIKKQLNVLHQLLAVFRGGVEDEHLGRKTELVKKEKACMWISQDNCIHVAVDDNPTNIPTKHQRGQTVLILTMLKTFLAICLSMPGYDGCRN